MLLELLVLAPGAGLLVRSVPSLRLSPRLPGVDENRSGQPWRAIRKVYGKGSFEASPFRN